MIRGKYLELFAEGLFPDAEVFRDVLKLAGAVPGACEAFVGMVRMHQLHDSLPDFHELRIVGNVIQSLHDGGAQARTILGNSPLLRRRCRKPPRVPGRGDSRGWGFSPGSISRLPGWWFPPPLLQGLPLILIFNLDMVHFLLSHDDGAELAGVVASAAFDALGLVDDMGCLAFPGDTGNRALTGAYGTSDAFVRIDV